MIFGEGGPRRCSSPSLEELAGFREGGRNEGEGLWFEGREVVNVEEGGRECLYIYFRENYT